MGKKAKATVETEISRVEGFDVTFVGDDPGGAQYVDDYPFVNAANAGWTVKKWRDTRWAAVYPEYDVEVLDGNYEPVHGKTLLRNVRDSYVDEYEIDDEDVEVDVDDNDDDEADEGEFWTAEELEAMSLGELRAVARDYDLETTGVNRADLIRAILNDPSEDTEPEININPAPPVGGTKAKAKGSPADSGQGVIVGSTLTGTLRSKINALWDSFWAGGISNPLEVMEQITYLLFLKRLDDLQTLAENKASQLGRPIENPVFPAGNDELGRPYANMRWSLLKNMAPAEMFKVMADQVFPFLRGLGGEGSTYSSHMQDATFTIPTANLLSKAVDMMSDLPMNDQDTKGDIYEYMLAKIASAGQNGQFRTPRHIIDLMVAMREPKPSDTILDPACGTCGFLVGAASYIRTAHPEALLDTAMREHFNHDMFYGYDFDHTMLRIGSMNMLLHGVENPDIRNKDSLSEEHSAEEEKYSLVLANPPFAGSLDYESVAKDLLQVVKTKKTELLFLALFLRVLKPGGRAAVIVPDGVLFGSSKAHKELRRILVEDQQLQGIVSLPSGAFRPYAGVSTAILFFTKTNSGGTDDVWFYDLQADGFSLDDKRSALLDADRLGVAPRVALTSDEHAKNNLPDVLARWNERNGSEQGRACTDQSFCVPKADVVANDYDLSINRYKEVVHEEVVYRAPKDIIADLMVLEDQITQGLTDLDAMLG